MGIREIFNQTNRVALTAPIPKGQVREFLKEFERIQATQDFDRVAPLIHRDALFRFNDGDFRGHAAIREAFETTWSLEIAGEVYRIDNISVEHTDARSAVASFDFEWSGDGPDGRFRVTGRGTTVLVEQEGSLKVLVEHLSR